MSRILIPKRHIGWSALHDNEHHACTDPQVVYERLAKQCGLYYVAIVSINEPEMWTLRKGGAVSFEVGEGAVILVLEGAVEVES